MGLDLCVDGQTYARWSYSGFNQFRGKLAAEIGINLNTMEGFNNVDRMILQQQGFTAYREAIEEDLAKPHTSWDTVTDPIKYLLNHSDCDGLIHQELCGTIADRLELLIKDWPEKFDFHTDPFWQTNNYPEHMILDNYDKVQAAGLVQALRTAAATNKPLEFC